MAPRMLKVKVSVLPVLSLPVFPLPRFQEETERNRQKEKEKLCKQPPRFVIHMRCMKKYHFQVDHVKTTRSAAFRGVDIRNLPFHLDSPFMAQSRSRGIFWYGSTTSSRSCDLAEPLLTVLVSLPQRHRNICHHGKPPLPHNLSTV